MKHEEFKEKLEAIPNLELAEMAEKALSKLCSTGGQSFTMTVPPRLNDTDMLLSEVIKRFRIDSDKIKYWNKLVEELEKFSESYDHEGNIIQPEKEGDLTDIGQIAWDITGFSGISSYEIRERYFNI